MDTGASVTAEGTGGNDSAEASGLGDLYNEKLREDSFYFICKFKGIRFCVCENQRKNTQFEKKNKEGI